jgi:hypothetical protein
MTAALWVLAGAVVWLATAVFLALLIGKSVTKVRDRQVPRDVPRPDDDRGDRP